MIALASHRCRIQALEGIFESPSFLEEAIRPKRLDGFEVALTKTQQPHHRLDQVRALHALRDGPPRTDHTIGSLPASIAQRFFYRHKAQAIEIALYRTPVVPAAAKFYVSRIGQVANREQNGRQVINKLEIARHAFDPVSGLPILPGSSLKGAMRTAILEKLRAGRPYPLSDQDAGKHYNASRKAREMERDILEGSFQTDPLRLLKVGDCVFRPGSYKAKNAQGEEIRLERQPRTILFQANRKNPVAWDSEATAVWLATNEPGASTGMLPFGWVFVQVLRQ